AHCDLSELKQVCYGDCDKMNISTNSGAMVNCSSNSSKLWFHSTSEAGLYRQWYAVDSIRCQMGGWV
ncbi:hypothetical protein PENTCL1PPCAC_12322, partial [Pristionchus entomophagus]